MLAPRYADDGRPLLPLTPAQLDAKRSVDRKVQDGAYRFERVACVICGGSALDLLAEKDRCGLRTPVRLCDQCGLVQTNPRMTEDAYRAYYNAEYSVLHDGDLTAADVFAREHRRGGTICRFIEQHIDGSSLRGQLVAEVGCGSGGILAAFRERGCEVVGVDIGAGRLAHGRDQGLDLRVGTLADLELSRPPQIVVYSHVLEHVLDPRRELSQLHDVLHPEGLVYVEVPGIKRLDHGYEHDFLRYLQNAHVYHFSATTLDNLMGKHRFARVVGDELVRALYRPCRQTTASAQPREHTSDREAVRRSLQESERRRQQFHPKAALRSALIRLGLFPLARRGARLAKRLLQRG